MKLLEATDFAKTKEGADAHRATQQAQPETNLDVAAAKMKAGVTVKGKGQRQMMVAGVKAGRSSGDRKAAL